jgi:SpoVK/Ycf46/Vps4 family AAA+-type ATPase
LGPTPQTRLTLDDFQFLGKDRLAYFVESLRGAVESNGTSLKNSCLYGQPGVGKTELTAVIAKHLGVPLYAIGLSSVNEKDALSDSIKEPSRQDRLLAWRRAKFLVNAAHIKCIFLIDEAEDILRDPNVDRTSTRASKSYLNALLEENNVPTVFITNKIDSMEPSTVRRELPILEVQSPSLAYKKQTFLKYANYYKIQLTDEQTDSLINEFIHGLELAVIERVLFITSRRKDIEGDAVFKALQISLNHTSKLL